MEDFDKLFELVDDITNSISDHQITHTQFSFNEASLTGIFLSLVYVSLTHNSSSLLRCNKNLGSSVFQSSVESNSRCLHHTL